HFGESQPPPPLMPLDWVTLAFPCALGLGLFLLALPDTSASQRLRVSADDHGVTVQRFLHRRHAIPWDDILALIRTYDWTTATPQVGYLLWGRAHGIAFDIAGRKQVLTGQRAQANARKSSTTDFIFEGGFERYTADARRLLATIVARGHKQLRVSR